VVYKRSNDINMINKILILACDRPEYLKQVIESIVDFDCEKFILIDKPANPIRLKGHKTLLKLVKKSNIPYEINEIPLGCSESTFKLLDYRVEGVNLFLEDDIVINVNTKDILHKTIENIDLTIPFIVKLNQYCWGWIANDLFIDKFKKFRTTDEILTDTDFGFFYSYEAFKAFRENSTKFIWDQIIDYYIGLSRVNITHIQPYLTSNIGTDSSRLNNEEKSSNTTIAVIIDGVFQELKQLSRKPKLKRR